MSVQDRNRQLRVVAEILLVHIPRCLEEDQELARDLLAVAGTALHTIHEDAEKSARAWDKRAYDVKADQLRREWDWALGAANYVTGLALRGDRLTRETLARACRMIKVELERPARRQIKDPAGFRGAARAVRAQQAQKRRPVRR
jgi:hypothetical protein